MMVPVSDLAIVVVNELFNLTQGGILSLDQLIGLYVLGALTDFSEASDCHFITNHSKKQ
jgi:hypothetical protein